MVVAHGVILGLGWSRLALLLGPLEAWNVGVEPFLWGGVVKSVAAAATVWGFRRWKTPKE
jgi:biotin transporter BioY